MKGVDLLNSLQELTEEELNREVYVFADHGQEFYQADSFDANESTTALEYCLEDYYVHSSDLEEGQEVYKFISIS